MRFLVTVIAAAAAAASLVSASAASSMSRQAAPLNADGSSKLVDPDETVEHMADQQQAASNVRSRAFSDSFMEARDAARLPAANGFVFRPFR